MKLILSLILLNLIKFNNGQNSCSSGTINTGGTFSSVQDCLGDNNENIHELCTDFCEGHLWEFDAGTGEGCWIDSNTSKVTAFCVCHYNNCSVCPAFGSVCQTQCGSPLVPYETYSDQQECLGYNNENIHYVCSEYCIYEGNGWVFIPGYGEGCWVNGDNGKMTAWCKCHTGCPSGNCPQEVGDSCLIDFPICPQDGHAVNIEAWLSTPTYSSCAAHCAFNDFFFSEGCESQGCYVAGDNSLGPCVMNSGSSDYYCHCGEIAYRPPE